MPPGVVRQAARRSPLVPPCVCVCVVCVCVCVVCVCVCGSPFQKFTTLLCSPRIAAKLAHMSLRRCALCDAYEAHKERAVGVFGTRVAAGSRRAAAHRG